MTPVEPLLEVTDLHVSYGPIPAVRGLSMHVGHGEIVALVGANGAGKTTTLRAICGLLAPVAGDIRLDGRSVARQPAQRVVGLGVAHAPEGRELFPTLTVLENLELGHWVHRAQRADFMVRRDRVMEFFPKLRLRARQAAGTMSGGEQQMLVIARALMSAPRLLLIDELSLGLAPRVVGQLFEILHQVNTDGTAILIVEQFVHMALANSHRAYALAKGAVVMCGTSADLLSKPELVATYLGGN